MHRLLTALLAATALACADKTPADSVLAAPEDGGDGGQPDGGDGGDGGPGDDSDTPIGDSAPATDTVDTGPWTLPARPDLESAPEDASWRYGGGEGYPDLVDPAWPVVTRVESLEDLQAALAAAFAGDIIYVEDHAAIDLTGLTLAVPGGVWLAGGRGRDGAPGGLLYAADIETVPILAPGGDDVRITGLRIHGADPDECSPLWPDDCTGEDATGGANCRDCGPASIGIQAAGADRLEVDNCELAGWSYAAVWLKYSEDNRVHHNHIHHTQRQGLGYGVVLTRGDDDLVTVEIAWNRFDYNRHAVAGSGEPGQDYVARDNLVLEHAIGHVFDMHGENENTDNGSEYAGGDIRIFDNTVLVPDQYALVVRGRPEHGSWLHGNCLARADADAAALQRYYKGNFYVDEGPHGADPNAYGQSGPDCHTPRFCHAAAGAGPWRYGAASDRDLSELAFGDFDGDGRADVLQTTGSEWQVSYGGEGAWERLNASSYTLDALAVADFDGDGVDDVFAPSGGEWRVSWGGSQPWETLNAAVGDALGSIAIADFDGDGRADVFRATGAAWEVSYSGAGPWAHLNTSSYGLESLRFGDLDGDGRADVLRADGGAWHWSSGGAAGWEQRNTSTVGVTSLILGDVDGDGADDALRPDGVRWQVSYGASSPWSVLRITGLGVGDFALADLDGDGARDAFATGCL